MAPNADISDILESWEFDPDNQVRVIQARDGRDVLQVRQPLGIEQYELEGRPDGQRPEGRGCYVDLFRERLQNHVAEHGSDEGFRISHEEFQQLQSEGVLYYYRYLVLFQMGDFERTARDTEHNLQICELAEKYVDGDEDKNEILQYRPYILRMFAVAKAMISMHQELQSAARQILESAIAEIERMPPIDTPAFQFERIRSLKYLRSTLQQVREQKADPLARLRAEMQAAIDEEDYEKAAELRDRIRAMDQDLES